MRRMTEYPDITLVITSCRRFDLLKQTIASMRSWIGKFPEKILIEDSNENPSLFGQLRDEGFTILRNEENLGQHKSIDRAYAQVHTDYIFHCEDDWVFLGEPNFMGARSILEDGIEGHDRISCVCFRDFVPRKWKWSTSREMMFHGSKWKYSFRQTSRWNAFTWNPCLLRRDLQAVTGSYQSFLTEGSIARYLRKNGYIVVWEISKKIDHIGAADRHITRRSKTVPEMIGQWLKKDV